MWTRWTGPRREGDDDAGLLVSSEGLLVLRGLVAACEGSRRIVWSKMKTDEAPVL